MIIVETAVTKQTKKKSQQNLFQQQFLWENNHNFLTSSVSLPLLQREMACPHYSCNVFLTAYIENSWRNRIKKKQQKKPEQNKNPNAFLVTTKFKWKVTMLPVIH